jgi:glycosyltransferase involved in cell wall biosynthesis
MPGVARQHRSLQVGFLTATKAWGGTEAHTLAVARALASRGHSVVILQLGHDAYTTRGASDLGAGVSAVGVNLPGPARGLPSRYWRQLLQSHRVDMVVVPKGSFRVRYRGLDLAMLTSRRPRISIEHATPPDPPVRTSRRHLAGLLPGLGLWHLRFRAGVALHRAAFGTVIAVADAIKQRMVEDYGYTGDAVTVIHNGIDVSRFHDDPEARAATRQLWGIPAAAFVFGTMARLVPEKRLDRLLHAFRGIAADSEPWLVVVGSGPEAGALHALAAELGLGERCVWAGESRAAWSAYPALDCFVSSSDVEGLPYALLEAMACERIPVATDAGGVSEVVIDKVTGRLTGQDPAALESAMREVMAYPREARAAIGRRAREQVVEHHDQLVQIAAVATLIEQVSDAGGAA